MDDNEYYKFAYHALLGGYTCGLGNPIEDLVNQIRGDIQIYGYAPDNLLVARYLVEFYEAAQYAPARSSKAVIDWVNEHYSKDHLCYGFFDTYESVVYGYLEGRKHGSTD